jgi:hypothetical protein
MIFKVFNLNISIQFQIVTRFRNLELRIRIRQKVSDPCGSGSTTLPVTKEKANLITDSACSHLISGQDRKDSAHDCDGGDGGAAESGQEDGGHGTGGVRHTLADQVGQATKDGYGAQRVDVKRVAPSCVLHFIFYILQLLL